MNPLTAQQWFACASIVVALGLLAASRRSPEWEFVVYTGMALACWYWAGSIGGVVIYGTAAVCTAVHLYVTRPRPQWWNGEHERIEQT